MFNNNYIILKNYKMKKVSSYSSSCCSSDDDSSNELNDSRSSCSSLALINDVVHHVGNVIQETEEIVDDVKKIEHSLYKCFFNCFLKSFFCCFDDNNVIIDNDHNHHKVKKNHKQRTHHHNNNSNNNHQHHHITTTTTHHNNNDNDKIKNIEMNERKKSSYTIEIPPSVINTPPLSLRKNSFMDKKSSSNFFDNNTISSDLHFSPFNHSFRKSISTSYLHSTTTPMMNYSKY